VIRAAPDFEFSPVIFAAALTLRPGLVPRADSSFDRVIDATFQNASRRLRATPWRRQRH
jgi:hypothetical protein